MSDQLDPKTFDLDEWLAGASCVTKFVEVYGKPHLQAEIDELEALAADADETDRDEILERPTSCETMESSRAIQGRRSRMSG